MTDFAEKGNSKMKCSRIGFFFCAVLLCTGFLAAGSDSPSNEKDGSEQGGEAAVQERVPRRANRISVEEAIENAGPTDPIQLNQPIFVTEDQVRLHAIYYKGNADDSTTPVVLVHGRDGKKEDWKDIAQKLAEDGKAVLIPDLRGFGESTTAIVEDYFAGGGRPAVRANDGYEFGNFRESDCEALCSYDGDLWFWFLVELHNKKRINIRKLVFVTDGFGAAVAGNWILRDWQAGAKKGRFTRGLVMISPEMSVTVSNGENESGAGDEESGSSKKGKGKKESKGETVFDELGARAKPGTVQYKIFAGSLDEKVFDSAQSIAWSLGKEKESVPEEERKVKLESFKTDKQGLSLAKVSSFEIPQKIIDFINNECQLSAKQQKWQAIKTF